jgi:hypothetical protein
VQGRFHHKSMAIALSSSDCLHPLGYPVIRADRNGHEFTATTPPTPSGRAEGLIRVLRVGNTSAPRRFAWPGKLFNSGGC